MARRPASKSARTQQKQMPEIREVRDPAERLFAGMAETSRRHVEFMERIGGIYVESFRDLQLAAELTLLIENAALRRNDTKPRGPDNRLEGVGFAVLADSRSGKSAAIDHLIRTHPIFHDFGEPTCLLVSVTAPAPCVLQRLAMQIIRSSGYRIERELKENVAWSMARDQLFVQNRLFLSLGEIQRVLHIQGDEQRKKVVETLVGLMTEGPWPPLQVIFSGLPSMIPVFESQEQLAKRTRWVTLERIDPKQDYNDIRKGIRAYEKAGVSLTQVADRDTVARISHAANYRWGLFWELLRGGIDVCVRSDRRAVTLEDLSDNFAGRTTEPVRLNVFHVDDWLSIDPTAIRFKGDEHKDEPDRPALKRAGDD